MPSVTHGRIYSQTHRLRSGASALRVPLLFTEGFGLSFTGQLHLPTGSRISSPPTRSHLLRFPKTSTVFTRGKVTLLQPHIQSTESCFTQICSCQIGVLWK
ncbi:hypothetical protein M378DRAFT_739399 [Amanita muscaria Koide BX008]|uniref:Uncharacterized protein n=1 Tax=Amanita muscaria (strain Koide BX008) TaxID=946122 RepID=A0A0C2T8E5_AMAMK|nr:hypothetical protein M378DRAFT_739399 [Amanita muscaria Koide BX008]